MVSNVHQLVRKRACQRGLRGRVAKLVSRLREYSALVEPNDVVRRYKVRRVLSRLSNIIKQFNDLFGNIEWHDADKIRKVVTEEIPARVAQDKAYQNAQANSGKQNARLEHDKALNRVVLELLDDHTELFKQFSDNPNFKRWLADMVFDSTYRPGQKPSVPPQSGAQA